MSYHVTHQWMCDLCKVRSEHASPSRPDGWKRLSIMMTDSEESDGVDCCPTCQIFLRADLSNDDRYLSNADLIVRWARWAIIHAARSVIRGQVDDPALFTGPAYMDGEVR